MRQSLKVLPLALALAFSAGFAQAGNDRKYMDDPVPYWQPVDYVTSAEERAAAHERATAICRSLHGVYARARINWVQRRIWCYLR